MGARTLGHAAAVLLYSPDRALVGAKGLLRLTVMPSSFALHPPRRRLSLLVYPLVLIPIFSFADR